MDNEQALQQFKTAIYQNNYEQWEKQSKKSVAYHLANRINDLLINYNKRAINA